jgi:uncharacterized membrane protein (DUF485 family)
MELFSQKFFSIYFNVSIVMIVLWMITKVLKNLSIDKAIKMSIHLPEDRKERMIRRYSRIISSQRIILWLMPFGFLLVLVAFVLLSVFPELNSGLDIDVRKAVMLMGIFLAVGFIHFVEDSFYKKKNLKAIDNEPKRSDSAL